jgi:hypothetical protein
VPSTVSFCPVLIGPFTAAANVMVASRQKQTKDKSA